MKRPLDGRCQVSVYGQIDGLDRLIPNPCDQPIIPGALFCAHHEQDRIRLGGTPR